MLPATLRPRTFAVVAHTTRAKCQPSTFLPTLALQVGQLAPMATYAPKAKGKWTTRKFKWRTKEKPKFIRKVVIPVDPPARVATAVLGLRESPKGLLNAAHGFIARSKDKVDHLTGFSLLAALRVSPFIGKRIEAMQSLIAKLSANNPAQVVPSAWKSHANAIAALSTASDDRSRKAIFGHAVATRYADAPFMSATDFATALPTFQDRIKPTVMYLDALPRNFLRTQTAWERESFVARKSSYEKQLANAMKTLHTVEALLTKDYPAVMESPETRVHLQAALAGIGARTEPRKHWEWLLQHDYVTRAAVDNAMRLAQDTAALQQVRTEAMRVWTRKSAKSLPCLHTLYATHLARLGELEEAERVLGKKAAHLWFIHARKGTAVKDLIKNSPTRSDVIKYTAMAANGIDFAAAEWILRPYH